MSFVLLNCYLLHFFFIINVIVLLLFYFFKIQRVESLRMSSPERGNLSPHPASRSVSPQPQNLDDRTKAFAAELETTRKKLASYQEHRRSQYDRSLPMDARTERLIQGKMATSTEEGDDEEAPEKEKRKKAFSADLAISRKIADDLLRKEKQLKSEKAAQRRELRSSIEESRIYLHQNKELSITPKDESAAFRAHVDRTANHLANLYGAENVKKLDRKGSHRKSFTRRGKSTTTQSRPQNYFRGDAPLLAKIAAVPAEDYSGPCVSDKVREEFVSRGIRERRSNANLDVVSSEGAGGVGGGPTNMMVSGAVGEHRGYDAILQETNSRLLASPVFDKRYYGPDSVLGATSPIERSQSVASFFDTGDHSVQHPSVGRGRSHYHVGVTDVTRPTASTRSKRTFYCQTIFDEYGVVDGEKDRIEALPPLKPGHGYVSLEHRMRLKKEAMAKDLEEVRERRRNQPSPACSPSASATFSPMANSQSMSMSAKPTDGSTDVSGVIPAGGASSFVATTYQGPKHELGSQPPAVPDNQRVTELLRGVFVKSGKIETYLRKMEREARQGLLRPDQRRSQNDRLGGSSKSRF